MTIREEILSFMLTGPKSYSQIHLRICNYDDGLNIVKRKHKTKSNIDALVEQGWLEIYPTPPALAHLRTEEWYRRTPTIDISPFPGVSIIIPERFLPGICQRFGEKT